MLQVKSKRATLALGRVGRVGRAVNAAVRDFAREAAQLENGGGREAATERFFYFSGCATNSQILFLQGV